MQADRWEAQAEKLAGYPGPVYRKAYLAHFLDAGRRSQAEGDVRLADYCFRKLEDGLAEALPAAAPAAGPAPSPLERLAVNWRQERLDRFATLLARHGSRLSPLERDAYREKLGILQAGIRDARPGGRPPGDLLPALRRRLHRRLLGAHKAARAGTLKRSEPPADIPVGPYNDRHNLEGLLEEVGRMDPLWVGEFLDLYRDLSVLGRFGRPKASS